MSSPALSLSRAARTACSMLHPSFRVRRDHQPCCSAPGITATMSSRTAPACPQTEVTASAALGLLSAWCSAEWRVIDRILPGRCHSRSCTGPSRRVAPPGGVGPARSLESQCPQIASSGQWMCRRCFAPRHIGSSIARLQAVACPNQRLQHDMEQPSAAHASENSAEVGKSLAACMFLPRAQRPRSAPT